MIRLALLAVVIATTSGCATVYPSVPKGYKGPVATIQDTDHRIDAGKADMFYLFQIDGKPIMNSRMASESQSYGQGNSLQSMMLMNRVPTGEHVFTIVGRAEYAMPARALVSTVYQVKGDVRFSPVAGASYVIKGNLSEQKSSV